MLAMWVCRDFVYDADDDVTCGLSTAVDDAESVRAHRLRLYIGYPGGQTLTVLRFEVVSAIFVCARKVKACYRYCARVQVETFIAD